MSKDNTNDKPLIKKKKSKAELFFTDKDFFVILSDQQRKYFALEPINAQWEKQTFYSVIHNAYRRTVIFFRGNVVVKVIHEEYRVGEESTYYLIKYGEYDTYLNTENKTVLLPLTEKGKEKTLTASNVMSITPFGFEFFIEIFRNQCRIYAGKPRNNQEISIGEEDRISNIKTNEDFQEFMKYYIETCPDNYFEQLDEINKIEHQTVKFGAGDIFRCQIDRNNYVYGIIIGKTREIEKWPDFPEFHSFHGLMGQPIIIRMYDFVTKDKNVTIDELKDKRLLSPQVCEDNEIIWGTYKIVAHKSLEPDDIQFILHITKTTAYNEEYERCLREIMEGKRDKLPAHIKLQKVLSIEWGFSSIEIPWERVPEDIQHMMKDNNYSHGGTRLGISTACCGKTYDEILEKKYENIQYDLLVPENLDQYNHVMKFLGLPENCTIDDFVTKYNGISRAEYIRRVEK
ncbi:MAG: immunity 26/phosphotriesterase HocA family protein [Lachnospiraceae bacterium]|nr:immunity 26/phosphotriesterase HocA family protein [Lachnospiraceae bacterium]